MPNRLLKMASKSGSFWVKAMIPLTAASDIEGSSYTDSQFSLMYNNKIHRR